jgi:hypothetical protein
MATKALTHVAPRASLGPRSKLPDSEPGWRKLLIDGDAEALWRKIFLLIGSYGPYDEAACDHLTQEIFLHLLATSRLSLYIEDDYTDEEIAADLIALLPD